LGVPENRVLRNIYKTFILKRNFNETKIYFISAVVFKVANIFMEELQDLPAHSQALNFNSEPYVLENENNIINFLQ
jgi:hypothetical protein